MSSLAGVLIASRLQVFLSVGTWVCATDMRSGCVGSVGEDNSSGTRDSTSLRFLRCCALAAASDRVREECVYVHTSRDDGAVNLLPFSTASKFYLLFCAIKVKARTWCYRTRVPPHASENASAS
jgi:hypothetical protein